MTMANSERMAAVDTAWLRCDRPVNPMVIVGVLMLEGPLDLEKLRRTIAAKLLAFDRFRQRVEPAISGYWWSDDRHFNIDRHIKRARLPGLGRRAELEHFVADLASHPLDMSRPLWQIHIVEGYEAGAALVVRIHHAIADGIALIAVLLSMTGSSADASELFGSDDGDMAEEPAKGSWSDLLSPLTGVAGSGLRFSGELWRQAVKRAADPAATLKEGAGVAAELAYLMAMPGDSETRFKGQPCGSKKVAWTDPLALPEVKVISRVFGCSINDLLLASVAGALHDYLVDKGDPTAGVEVRALVPVDLRSAHDRNRLGNQFGVIAVELPVGMDNPLTRLYEVHRRTQALKHSLEPPVTLGLITALGYAPKFLQDRLLDLLLSRCTAVMTNVPGPRHPLYLAGSRIRQAMFWVPQVADIGMGVSILSFDGKVQFGLMTDTAIVPDPEAIIAKFVPTFEQYLYFVLMEANVEPLPEDAGTAS
jgi:WS/DGAT/MGAT family acyltransferase